MSFKHISILLASVFVINNGVYSLNYYNNVVLPSISNNLENNIQLSQQYINQQNDIIQQKINEKLEKARQQLALDSNDEELKHYIQQLEALQAKQNVSQEVDMEELISLGLVDPNNNNIEQVNFDNESIPVNSNNECVHNNNTELNNNIAQNNNNIAQMNLGHAVIQNNNNTELNNNSIEVQNNNNIGQNNNHIIQAGNHFGFIFNNNNIEIFGIIPLNFNLSNSIENDLNMNTSFEELLNKIKKENNRKKKNYIIKEFCDYIFGNNYDNLNSIFYSSNTKQLKIIRETLELDDFSQYMKKYYMNIEDKLTTLVNTFIEQCQEGFYGDINDEDSFNKLFDKFFEQTKKIQYENKVDNAKEILNIIEDDLQEEENNNGQYEKSKMIKLLNESFELVKEHINNIFKELTSQRANLYNKFCNKDKQKMKFEIIEQKDTNYSLKPIIYSIMYEISNTTMNYKFLEKNCCQLREYLFNEYNSTYFKVTLQEDISTLKFCIKKNIIIDKAMQRLQAILDDIQEDTINDSDYELLLNKYAIKPNADLIKLYDKAYSNYFSSNIKFIHNLELDVSILKNNNKLNIIHDQLKLDLLDKIKDQKYCIDKADTYLLTEILYPIN